MEHLQQLHQEALTRSDPHDAVYYAERLQHVTDLAAGADPDDIFEQDSFRQLFTAEIHDLTHTTTRAKWTRRF